MGEAYRPFQSSGIPHVTQGLDHVLIGCKRCQQEFQSRHVTSNFFGLKIILPTDRSSTKKERFLFSTLGFRIYFNDIFTSLHHCKKAGDVIFIVDRHLSISPSFNNLPGHFDVVVKLLFEDWEISLGHEKSSGDLNQPICKNCCGSKMMASVHELLENK